MRVSKIDTFRTVYKPVNWQSYSRISPRAYLGYLRISPRAFTHKYSRDTSYKPYRARLSESLLYVPVVIYLYLAAPFCGKPEGFRTTRLAN